MRRIGTAALIAAAFTFSNFSSIFVAPSQAQTVSSNNLRKQDYATSSARVGVGSARNSALSSLGYIIAPGVILSPTLSSSTGFDGNFDEFFAENESGYTGIDGSVLVAFVKQNAATTVTLKTSRAYYEGLSKKDRWDAGAAIDSYVALASGPEISVGAFFLRDSVSFSENETAAAYSQVEYKNQTIETFMRSRVYQVQYVSPALIPAGTAPALVPFLVNSEFNTQRLENAAGILIGRNRFIGVYTEVGYSWIDYINQKIQNSIDRDAEDFYVLGGIRVTFSPFLRADIGYRYNYRDIDDQVVSSHSSDNVDLSVVWAPTPFFVMTFNLDRKLGDPFAPFSRVADVTTYSLAVNYRLTNRTSLNMRGAHERTKEVGDLVTYEEKVFQAELTYDVNSKTQLYSGILIKRVEELNSNLGYDRLRVGAGLRARFGPEPAKLGGNAPGDIYGLNIRRVRASLGYSFFDLPQVFMTTITDPFLTHSLDRVNDHGGEVNGLKFDAAIDDFASHRLSNGRLLWFGLKGFWGHYQGTDNSSCSFGFPHDCVFVNIVDNTAASNNTGAFGQLLTRTKREVDYWGFSLELTRDMSESEAAFEKRYGHLGTKSPYKFAAAVKAIQQELNLFAIDVSVPDPVDYRESLDTFYYGAYLGYEKEVNLGSGFSLALNAEAGVYYADTNYKGDYVAFIPIGGGNFITDQGKLNLNDQSFSFIGTLRVDLNKRIGKAKVGVFAEGEYFSYAPKMLYNDHDVDGGFPFDIAGTQVGTKIDDGHAFNYTIGGKISWDLN